jgi:hypothetical protein
MIGVVHEHIKSIPHYQSHYSTVQNPHKTYVNLELKVSTQNSIISLGVRKMEKYLKSRQIWQNILLPPQIPKMCKSDMCRTCDELIIKINKPDNEGKENERKKLKEQNKLHLDEAKEMQDSLKTERERPRANPQLGLVVLTMDLQQEGCLLGCCVM